MAVRTRAVIGALALVAVVPLAACTPTAPPPQTSPTPVPTSAAPTPPESPQERKEREDFEAAEKAYRTFTQERSRLIQDGGVSQATAVMKRTAAGPFLKVIVQFLRVQKDGKLRGTSGIRIAYVEPGAYSPTELTLKVCEDGSRIRVIDEKGRQKSEGQILKLDLQVRKLGGVWKVWNGDDEAAKTCGS